MIEGIANWPTDWPAPEAIGTDGFRSGPIWRFGTVSSTMDIVRHLTFALPADLVVVARDQTAGRGRYGRKWVSHEGGGIYLTAWIPWRGALPNASNTIQAAAIALARTCEELGATDVRIKWPNDVQIDGAKLAGLLAEAHRPKAAHAGSGPDARARGTAGTVAMGTTDADGGSGAGTAAGGGAGKQLLGEPVVGLSIGIGVNLTTPDIVLSTIDQPAIALAQALGRRVDVDEVLIPFLRRWGWLHDIVEREGFAGIRKEFAALCPVEGRTVWLREGDRRTEVAVEALNADGSLTIRPLEGGAARVIHAGELEG